MDESDSDSENGPPTFDDGDRYPLEGKYINAADKAEIMAMPEIKREELLADRSYQIERDRQNRALRQLLQARDAENKKSEKKRKAEDADLEDGHRKTSRQRTKVGGGRVGEASSGIDSLKRARDEKADRQRRRQEDLERNGGRRGNAHEDSDDDAGAGSELEWDDGKPKTGEAVSPTVHSPPCELVHVHEVRIGRTKFAKICFYPGFNEAITGAFVRVNIGVDKATGNNVYRMAEVKGKSFPHLFSYFDLTYFTGFSEGKPYAMEKENGQTFITTQYVRAAHGKAERDWPFITCSDSSFTDAEWNRYKQTCLSENVKIPNSLAFQIKAQDIYNLENRSWTDAELTEKLKRSGALDAKFKTVERHKLNKQLNQAKVLGDVERQEQIKADLARLDGPKLAYGTSLYKREPPRTGPKEMSQQDRLAILNQEMRRKNNEEIKAAQLKEMREQRKIEAALARGEDAVVDHSRRVRTRAVLTHDVKNEGGSGTSTPAKTATPKLSPKKDNAPLPHIAKLQAELEKQKLKGGIPTIRRPLCDDDIIGAIDLGIEIEL
jgi:RNA polymerase-associated protein RTF1